MRRWLLLTFVAACFALVVAGLAFGIASHEPVNDNYLIATAAGGVAFSVLAGLVGIRRPENRLWIVYAVIGGCLAVGTFTAAYAYASYLGFEHPLPFASFVSWIPAWLYVPALVSMLTFSLLLFPTGRLPSRRWWPVPVISVASMTLNAIPFAVVSWAYRGLPITDPNTPTPDTTAFHVAGAVGSVGQVLLLPAALLSVASLVVRFRRADSEQREQMKWLMFALFVVVASLLKGFATNGFGDVVEAVDYTVIAAAVGVAILKYRLWDIDVVINKAVVYVGLASFITVVYVAVVVGVGAAVGAGGKPNLGLSIAATALVAVAFAPVRQRVQHLANRVVYGARATPYETLSAFAGRISHAYAGSDVLDEMARLAGEATGAARSVVWLARGEWFEPRGLWPREAERPAQDHGLGAAPGEAVTILVKQDDELLGRITLDRPNMPPIAPREERLLEDLAAQGAPVLRNLRLIDDLRGSRLRLIQAQDQERRRLERNIHDGAQQRLVALSVRFNLAQRTLPEDAGREREAVADLSRRLTEALDDMRNLARGIYPPLLADKGLVAALEAQAARASVPTQVSAAGVSRFPQVVEAAVYFCCLEAMRNVAKHAKARQVLIRLEGDNGEIRFEVRDDGVGFDPSATPRGSGLVNMADRLAALDGDLQVRSHSGEGTVVTGRVPVMATHEQRAELVRA